MKIKILSDSTVNRIAAGEVIERPASVVKELVENAIDASATKIDIILEQAGKNLIIVSDNGVGMSPEDLKLAIQSHATSKLDEDNLLNIHTFGFRGEALPSIGAVSKLTITSKERGSNKAYKIQLIGGKGERLESAVHNEGTKAEVRDLFFATPARLKFLRTDKTELAACVDIVKKIAIAHPHIAFALSHDSKNILKVQGEEDYFINSIKQRIIEVIGQDFAENSSIVDLKRQGFSIAGLVGLPTFNRASPEEQFLFINNRPIRDKILAMALRVAYQDYLAKDRHPVAAIFLQIDPQLVDVNVHPTKSEVRFQDPNLVREMLITSIKEALSANSHKVATNIARTTLGYFNVPQPKPATPDAPSLDYSVKDIDHKSHFAEAAVDFKHQELAEPRINKPFIKIPPLVKTEQHQEQPILDGEYPLGAAKAQLHSTYIISQTEDSIIIIDQHAAHERLGYEKIKQAMKAGSLIKQRLLLPEIVELPDERRAGLLYDKRNDLSMLGLTLEKFGERSIIVSEVPSLIGDVNIQQLIQDLADHLSSIGESTALLELIEHVTETYACHYSVRAGRKLSIHEMNDLLRQMEQTPFSGQCNHGRPTYIELKLKDVEKLFGRR